MSARVLFNDGWSFCKYPFGTGMEELREADFAPVHLPHDWLIGQVANLYEDGTGWYRKKFDFSAKQGERTEIYFCGVYMDTTVYVNRREVGIWKYGYSSFFFDITDALEDGENEILVRVDHKSPNSRWYSGAGIYRDVYLNTKPAVPFVTDSLYISAKPAVPEMEAITQDTDLSGDWVLSVSAEISALDSLSEAERSGLRVRLEVPELGVELSAPLAEALKAGEPIRAAEDAARDRYAPDGTSASGEVAFLRAVVRAPKLWTLEEPKLYECTLSLAGDGGAGADGALDSVSSRFGFRSFVYDRNKGLFVNGKHTKMNGVCEHHDLGAIGAAFNRSAMRRKLEILREMGVNAVRTAHNMPDPGLLELCDEMGFLVMDEAFDMWERPKTEYDYARFFPEWHARDVRSWIRRDRNHPCIVLWSIGNEIYDTHADERGQTVTRFLMEEARSHDPLGNAQIAMGSNFMPWEGAQKCADILKFIGYNYAEKLYDEHHAAHPDWQIFGSETSSTVQSRGIYHFPYEQPVLSDDDEQCSSLGNCTTGWGAPSTEYCILAERDHEFSLGQFLWSGFDYIGEPTPYHTKNSYFGQIDLAGFPKEQFYLYKSAWTDVRTDPFVHICPHWDWNEGQIIDVRVMTNAPAAELFVNGVSQGEQAIDHAHGEKLTANWKVPYAKGEITAVAYGEDHKELARETRRSFGEAASLKLEQYRPDRAITAGRGELAFFTVSAQDADGHPVENANNLVHIEVSGAGHLAGLDNGDSTDAEEYKGHYKRLFSGKLLVMAFADEAGELTVRARSEGLSGAEASVSVQAPAEGAVPGLSAVREELPEAKPEGEAGAARIRKIELSSEDGQRFFEGKTQITVRAKLLPEAADTREARESLIWRAVTDSGIDTPVAKLHPGEDGTVQIEALADGSFRLRCMSKCGAAQVKVISELEFASEGLGQALLDPYDFIAGGMYSYTDGEIGNGNERGITTGRGVRTAFGFDHVDFGSFGADEITIPIFELGGDETPIEIWEGRPGEPGSEMLADVIYHKPSIWNTYQPETYKLKRRIKGVTTISFVFRQKVHFKGFSFARLEKAFELLPAAACDSVYGDQFTKGESAITGIGNNVTVEFHEMDFGGDGSGKVVVRGYTGNNVNTIHLFFADEAGTTREILEFPHADGVKDVEFAFPRVTGKKTVRFVFLPGSNFDFESVRFLRG